MFNTRKMLVVLLALVFVFGSVLAGCGGGKEAEPPQNSGGSNGGSDKGDTKKEDTAKADVQELNLMIGDEPPGMDSAKITDTISFLLINNTMEGLMRIGEGDKPIPGMAEKYDVSEDGTKFTFYLRDAKWSDGSPVTAGDFEYAWKRVLNPETAAAYAYIMYFIKGAEDYNTGKNTDPNSVGVKALDDKTLEVQLGAPAPFFIGMTAFGTFMPLKQEFVTAQGDKYATEPENLIFNGPFMMSEWLHDQRVTLVKNPNYWDANTVRLEKLTFDIVKEANTAVNLYESGEVDRTGLSSEQVEIYKNDPNFRTQSNLATTYLSLNTTNKVLSNVKIRTALSAALNRQALIDTVLNNGSVVAEGFIPYGMPGVKGYFRDEVGKLIKDNDPSYAKQMLQEGLAELGLDKMPKLTMLSSDNDTTKKAAEVLKEMWRQNLGIEVELEHVPFKERLKRSRAGEFEIVYSGWWADFNDPVNFLDLFVSGGGFNDPRYNSPEFDALIDFSKTSTDATERMKKLIEAEKILMKDLPIVPLYYPGSAYVIRPYVKGLVTHSFGADTDYKWTYIEGKDQ